MEELHNIALTVNSMHRTARAPARRLLSDLLQHDLSLTSTHVDCEHGVYEYYTILMDGDPVRSCLTFAVTTAEHDITTIENLAAPDGTPSPVQRTFHECHDLQYGFCTPEFLCTMTTLLHETPHPTEAEVVENISRNLYRCTGYQNIVKSVHRAAELLAKTDDPTPETAESKT